MNRSVNLTKRVKTADGSRFYPVVSTKNGHLTNRVYIQDSEETHPGVFYMDWYEGASRRRKSLGADSTIANMEYQRKEAELRARSFGVQVQDSNPAKLKVSDGRSVRVATEKYLDDLELIGKKYNTTRAYRKALEYFMKSCEKKNLEQINRDDMIKFIFFLRNLKNAGGDRQSDRSVYNKFLRVVIFLKACGIKSLVNRNDWPKYTEEDVEIYEADELEKFFNACSFEEKVMFKFFLHTGFREQEVMYTSWSDINFSSQAIKLRHKPEYRWTPKAYKERTIPMAQQLLPLLREWKKKADLKCPLLFPTEGCKPTQHFLTFCKNVARRAELDPEKFWLHKFRATFATGRLRAGVDIKTVQKWLGHSDLKSTSRYLLSLSGKEAQEQMDR